MNVDAEFLRQCGFKLSSIDSDGIENWYHSLCGQFYRHDPLSPKTLKDFIEDILDEAYERGADTGGYRYD